MAAQKAVYRNSEVKSRVNERLSMSVLESGKVIQSIVKNSKNKDVCSYLSQILICRSLNPEHIARVYFGSYSAHAHQAAFSYVSSVPKTFRFTMAVYLKIIPCFFFHFHRYNNKLNM